MKVGSLIRRIAEDCPCISVRLAPEPRKRTSLRWPDGASATLAREDRAVTIRYCWRLPAGDAERDGVSWQAVTQTIALAFDVPHFGGTRRFWQCPLCKSQARKIYDNGDGRFACKRCLRLANRSQRQRPWVRALRRAAKLRAYLGCEGSAADPLPPRPAGMHRTTYQALRGEVERLESIPAEAWLSNSRNVALGIRRDTMGAAKRRWWPGRNAWRG